MDGFLRASTTVTIDFTVYPNITEIATTSSDSQTFADRTVVATNPQSGSSLVATGKCFWFSNASQMSVSCLGTVNNAAATPSIATTLRSSETAGFSVVTWTAATNPVNRIAHNLNATPGLIITKSRSAANSWRIWHIETGRNKYLGFDTSAANTYSNYWSTSEPDSSTFGVWHDAGGANNDGTMVAYCFAPIEGYSAFGSYSTNGLSDGPYVYLGFRPRLLLLRTTSSANWFLIDTARDPSNGCEFYSFPDLPNAEGSGAEFIDILSNGFKYRYGGGGLNTSGETIIYGAWAEHPFKTSRAR